MTRLKYVTCSAPRLLQNNAVSSVRASTFLWRFQELVDAVQAVLCGLLSEDAYPTPRPQASRLTLLQEPNGQEGTVSRPSSVSLWALQTKSYPAVRQHRLLLNDVRGHISGF